MNPETLSVLTKVLNTAMVILIAYGLAMRRRPGVHIPVMLTTFVVDLANVLLVEIYGRLSKQKGAVEQAVSAIVEEGTFIQRFHIAVSLACLVGYAVAVVTGIRLYRRGVGRGLHRFNAGVFLLTRLSSYVTSFWM